MHASILDTCPNCDAYQVFASGKRDFESPEGIRVCHALDLLRELV
jgi:hypothetical protein